MALFTRPVIYGTLAVVSIAALWATSSDPPKKAKATKQKTATSRAPALDWVFPAAETSLKFEKPAGEIRNVFRPLIAVDRTADVEQDPEEQMRMPANLADGEAGWVYTGMVEIDGARMALLENVSTKQAGYVREGEIWKKSRIVRITMGYVVIAGPDSTQSSVFRYNANYVPKPKPQADPGFKPLDVSSALRGPIGLQVSPSPSGATPANSPPPAIRSIDDEE